MHPTTYVERFVNLLEPDADLIFNMSHDEARRRVGSGDVERVREIDGQFAIVQKKDASFAWPDPSADRCGISWRNKQTVPA